MKFTAFRCLFSYNPRKYIREKFLPSNPRKIPPSKLIHYTVYSQCIKCNNQLAVIYYSWFHCEYIHMTTLPCRIDHINGYNNISCMFYLLIDFPAALLSQTTQNQDTRSCVSGQERRAAHKCVTVNNKSYVVKNFRGSLVF